MPLAKSPPPKAFSAGVFRASGQYLSLVATGAERLQRPTAPEALSEDLRGGFQLAGTAHLVWLPRGPDPRWASWLCHCPFGPASSSLG